MVSKKDKFLASAQKLLERGNLEKALAEFLNAIREDPKDTRTWLRIAEIHVKRSENDKATEVYLRTADLYSEQGFFQRAVAVYKNIVKLSPGFVNAYTKLADIYKQLGLLSDAVGQLELAASVHQKAGRATEAMAAMRQIVEMNPDHPLAHIKLAEAASHAGLVDEAVARFSHAAELLRAQGKIDEYLRVAERLLFHRPNDVPLAKLLAQQYIERNNARFALTKLQACFKVDPRDPETLDMLARAFEQLGQKPKTVAVLKELAHVYSDGGRLIERSTVAQRILTLDPDDSEAREIVYGRAVTAAPPEPVGLAVLEHDPRFGAPGPRITFSEMEVSATPLVADTDDILVEGPSVQSSAEAVALASSMTEKTEAEASSDVQRILAEADMFVKYGLIERAVMHLRRVFEMVPTDVGAHERLAAVLLQLGRNGEAVAELEVLAEQLAATKPEAAANFARRALAVDPNARRATHVLAALERRGGGDEEFEEISTGMIEVMTTPEPAAEVPDVFLEMGDDAAGVVATATAEADDLSTQVFSLPVAGMIETVPEAGDVDVIGDIDDIGLTGDLRTSGEFPGASSARDQHHDTAVTAMPTATDEFAPLPLTVADDGNFAAMLAELEQVDFFLEQGMIDDARGLMDDCAARFAPSPLIEERKARLAAAAQEPEELLDALLEPDPDPEASFRGGPRDSGASIPRAVVAAGGEMDGTTRRDLGIGYKDMGLFDAAINEFAALAQDPSHEVFALTMIGECHEARGALGEAVAFYKKALNRPTVKEDEATQLYYQLGSAFQALEDRTEAVYFFEKVVKRDAAFRDARRRLTDLRDESSATGAR